MADSRSLVSGGDSDSSGFIPVSAKNEQDKEIEENSRRVIR